MRASMWLMLVLTVACSAAYADYTWQTYEGHQYALTQNYGSWMEAEAEALAAGGDLATVNNSAENNWLSSTFSNTYREGSTWNMEALAWIGLHKGMGGVWEWSGGEPVTFVNWYTGSPYTGDYVYLHVPPHPGAGTWWNDQDEPYRALGIIEVVPEPATLSLLVLGGLPLLRRKGYRG